MSGYTPYRFETEFRPSGTAQRTTPIKSFGEATYTPLSTVYPGISSAASSVGSYGSYGTGSYVGGGKALSSEYVRGSTPVGTSSSTSWNTTTSTSAANYRPGDASRISASVPISTISSTSKAGGSNFLPSSLESPMKSSHVGSSSTTSSQYQPSYSGAEMPNSSLFAAATSQYNPDPAPQISRTSHEKFLAEANKTLQQSRQMQQALGDKGYGGSSTYYSSTSSASYSTSSRTSMPTERTGAVPAPSSQPAMPNNDSRSSSSFVDGVYSKKFFFLGGGWTYIFFCFCSHLALNLIWTMEHYATSFSVHSLMGAKNFATKHSMHRA